MTTSLLIQRAFEAKGSPFQAHRNVPGFQYFRLAESLTAVSLKSKLQRQMKSWAITGRNRSFTGLRGPCQIFLPRKKNRWSRIGADCEMWESWVIRLSTSGRARDSYGIPDFYGVSKLWTVGTVRGVRSVDEIENWSLISHVVCFIWWTIARKR